MTATPELVPTDLLPGDVVRLTKGDVSVTGPVEKCVDTGHGSLFIPYPRTSRQPSDRTVGPRLKAFVRDGYALEVLSRVPRPAVPGIYKDREGDIYLRSESGKDYRLTTVDSETEQLVHARSGDAITETTPNGPGNAESRYAPFTLLVKLADLA